MSENLLLVVGSQFCEEKKDKFIDLLTNQYDYVVRYQGFGNANRLVISNNKLFKLNLIPSAIFNPRNRVVISQGVFLNLNVLLDELNYLTNNQVLTNNLYISDKCHLIFNFHIEMDKLLGELNDDIKDEFIYKGSSSCSDKALKLGIRICDLFDFNSLLQKLQKNLQFKNILLVKYGKQIFNPYTVAKQYFELGQKIKPFVINTSALLNYAYERKNKILFEADDSIMLDVDYGNYPNTTANNVVASLASGTGIAINKFKRILGVVKAYSVKEDNSYFITEIENQGFLSLIREKRKEHNSSDNKLTKKIGWLDLFLLKYVVSVSGLTELAITSIEELSSVIKLKVCVGYSKNGKILNYMPSSIEELKKCEPIYQELEGWNQDVSNIRNYDDLPDNLKNYIIYIESFLKVKVRFISVGSHQNQTIIKNN